MKQIFRLQNLNAIDDKLSALFGFLLKKDFIYHYKMDSSIFSISTNDSNYQQTMQNQTNEAILKELKALRQQIILIRYEYSELSRKIQNLTKEQQRMLMEQKRMAETLENVTLSSNSTYQQTGKFRIELSEIQKRVSKIEEKIDASSASKECKIIPKKHQMEQIIQQSDEDVEAEGKIVVFQDFFAKKLGLTFMNSEIL